MILLIQQYIPGTPLVTRRITLRSLTLWKVYIACMKAGLLDPTVVMIMLLARASVSMHGVLTELRMTQLTMKKGVVNHIRSIL